MNREQEIDLGTVQVHKRALADIANSAIRDIDGVRLIENDFKDSLWELLGGKNYSGIVVTVDESNQVSVELKIVVRYGLNVPEIAREVQDVVRSAVEKTIDLNLKDITVNIQGIERGGF